MTFEYFFEMKKKLITIYINFYLHNKVKPKYLFKRIKENE